MKKLSDFSSKLRRTAVPSDLQPNTTKKGPGRRHLHARHRHNPAGTKLLKKYCRVVYDRKYQAGEFPIQRRHAVEA